MFRQDKRLRNCEDMPLAGTMLTAVLFVAGGLISFARVQSAELSVELRVSPRVQKGRISPYVFGAGIDHKTNPLRAPKYPEKILIDEQAAAELQAWLAERSKLTGINGHKPIFCTLKGGKINPAQIREKLPKLAAKAGITKRVHPHGLRHTGASELVEEGISLTDIQGQLGHSSAATTDRYLHSLNPAARAERLRQRIW